jgi:hypothetical protein
MYRVIEYFIRRLIMPIRRIEDDMKVICINNDEAEASLTKNKEYKVLDIYGEDHDKYILRDDTDLVHVWHDWRFQVLCNKCNHPIEAHQPMCLVMIDNGIACECKGEVE